MLEDKDRKNLVSAPPIQTAVIGPNGVMSRAWSVWFRDLYKRVAYKGGNAIDDNAEAILDLFEQIEANRLAIKDNKEAIEANVLAIQKNKDDIASNAEAIAENASSIAQNALAIADNTDKINNNADAILLLSNSLDNHVNAFEAHGSNGDIVGFNDLAEEAKAGLVNRMAEIADAVDTQVNIATADIGPAPAAYDQAYEQSIADLVNENKAAINEIAQDFSGAVSVLNNLLAESKSSGQMTTL